MVTGNEPATQRFDSYGNQYDSGLTIRQDFAKTAMEGILAGIYGDEKSLSMVVKIGESAGLKLDQCVAKLATECADALIAELNKSE